MTHIGFSWFDRLAFITRAPRVVTAGGGIPHEQRGHRSQNHALIRALAGGLLALALVGCGGTGSTKSDTTTATPADTPTSTPTSTRTDAPTRTSTVTATATPTDTPAVIPTDTPTPTATPTGNALTYAIVDTAQDTCYGAAGAMICPANGAAFYGQDAQYLGNQPSYTRSADGLTVLDNVTGLTWQQSPDTNGDGVLNYDDKFTPSDAVAHCLSINTAGYGGFNDWRLPSIKELYSLVDSRGIDPGEGQGGPAGITPFIDRTYFTVGFGDTSAGERVIDAQYATSTIYVSTTMGGNRTMFGYNFVDGRIKGYPDEDSIGKKYYVQCVRGSTAYGINDFLDNGDQTITDMATGLTWAKGDSGVAMDWQTALAWVQTKNAENYLGHDDWRMPNAKELQSIVDYTRSPDTTQSAAINPLFTATSITNEGGQTDYPWYWSSTSFGGQAAVYVAFGRALGWMELSSTDTCYTLYDVHGAGAQRSDPKVAGNYRPLGPACSGGTAYGFGPQGDVQRGTNYVRLVRANTPTTMPTATPSPTGGACPSVNFLDVTSAAGPGGSYSALHPSLSVSCSSATVTVQSNGIPNLSVRRNGTQRFAGEELQLLLPALAGGGREHHVCAVARECRRGGERHSDLRPQ
jgi:hypothetical protein